MDFSEAKEYDALAILCALAENNNTQVQYAPPERSRAPLVVSHRERHKRAPETEPDAFHGFASRSFGSDTHSAFEPLVKRVAQEPREEPEVVPGGGRKRKPSAASSAVAAASSRESDAPRAYRPWGFNDDYKVCQAVVDKGVAGMPLRPAWFEENPIANLSDRSPGSLCNRYKRALQEPLARAVEAARRTGQEVDWTWLEMLHKGVQKNPFYSVEEDIHLCRLIMTAFPVGTKFDKNVLSVQWFHANARATKSARIRHALRHRDAMSMYHRRQKYLDSHLAEALNNRKPGCDPDFSFLERLHGKDWRNDPRAQYALRPMSETDVPWMEDEEVAPMDLGMMGEEQSTTT